MYLLALALAPSIAIILFIYSKDKYDREPIRHLFVSFLLGVLSTLPALVFQLYYEPKVLQFFHTKTIGYYAVFAYGVVGFGEEASKFIMLRWYGYTRKAFDEPFDGIIYAVMVSMGFATLENVGYVLQHGYTTGLLRMFLSVPAHACFAVLMGYHVGLAKFDSEHSLSYLWRGLLIAAFFHGTFDFFLFLQNSEEVTRYVSASLLVMGALVSYYFALRMSLRSIRLHQELSRREYNRRNNIV